MSGAGKSTALNALEDMGWEVIDNLPLGLLERLLDTQVAQGVSADRPLAMGIDSRTRGFDATAIVERIRRLRSNNDNNLSMLFLECSSAELERRYNETRRRHPLAADRPANEGITRERELLSPLRQWAEHNVDTSMLSTQALRAEIRARFGSSSREETIVSIMSFGFARGMPRNADLMFDMRFLRNPHWDPQLRQLTGLDERVGVYVREDIAYTNAVDAIAGLLLMLLPRYKSEGRAYVTVAFGCTGGKHRSVFVAEDIAQRLRSKQFSPTVTHRDLGQASLKAVERDDPAQDLS
ncbi:MAG: RNase adapter RapZ [Alphaproteobacteria bacterium]|nr:RNase adapter RapZ [Alphaproteobacteria bacterium]